MQTWIHDASKIFIDFDLIVSYYSTDIHLCNKTFTNIDDNILGYDYQLHISWLLTTSTLSLVLLSITTSWFITILKCQSIVPIIKSIPGIFVLILLHFLSDSKLSHEIQQFRKCLNRLSSQKLWCHQQKYFFLTAFLE